MFANETSMRNQFTLYLTNYLKIRIPEILIVKELILKDQIKINRKKRCFSLSLWIDVNSKNVSHSVTFSFLQPHGFSVQFSSSVLSNSLRPHESQHARPPCPSPTPEACSNSRPSIQWCHPTISSSVILFCSCLQSFPALESFPVSLFFASDGESIGVSASTSVLPMDIQDWFPLGGTGWMSLQSKGLSRVFSNTIFQRHQFFCTQLSLKASSHIHTWLLEKP